jgi:hydrophobic/amphiphilic exporter-1 (mainly G- bacteria), HAE1 family
MGQGPAAESHRGIAVVIIGGQSMCLLITLLMTPVAYSLFDDLEVCIARLAAFVQRQGARLRVPQSAAMPPPTPIQEYVVGD